MTEATTAPVDKAAKFKTLAENRTGKAMNAIATLRGLSNKGNYDYTPEQVAKIVAALRAEVDTIERLFAGQTVAKEGFSL